MQATVQPLGTSFAPASKSPSVTLTTTPRETDSRQAIDTDDDPASALGGVAACIVYRRRRRRG